jgi:hypothetical protein
MEYIKVLITKQSGEVWVTGEVAIDSKRHFIAWDRDDICRKVRLGDLREFYKSPPHRETDCIVAVARMLLEIDKKRGVEYQG